MDTFIILDDKEELVEYKGREILIDKEDKHFLDEYSWRYLEGYLITEITLHQLIMKFKPQVNNELSIDHINRDKSDNRKCNLRIVDKFTQALNKSNNSNSVMRGVYIRKGKHGCPLSWISTLTENYEIKQKSFSIKEYGYDKAKELAIEHRTDLLNNAKYKGKLKHENKEAIIIDEDNEEYIEYKGKTLLIDREDKHLLDEYHWSYNKANYLRMTVRLHSMILNVKPKLNSSLSIDHKNRNTLDVTRNNLRLVNKTIQMINRVLPQNTSGTVGVYFNKNRWVAEWHENKKRKSKSFSVNKYGGDDEAKQKAIEYRKEKISQIEEYKIALGL